MPIFDRVSLANASFYESRLEKHYSLPFGSLKVYHFVGRELNEHIMSKFVNPPLRKFQLFIVIVILPPFLYYVQLL